MTKAAFRLLACICCLVVACCPRACTTRSNVRGAFCAMSMSVGDCFFAFPLPRSFLNQLFLWGVWVSLLLLRAGCCCGRSAAGGGLTLLSMFSLSERFSATHRAPCALFESEEDMRASLDATLCVT